MLRNISVKILLQTNPNYTILKISVLLTISNVDLQRKVIIRPPYKRHKSKSIQEAMY